MNSSRRKVLVLGSDTRSFLSVVRSLGRRGIEVHVAWFQENSPALRSRYITRRWTIPTPADRYVDWKPRFLELLKREAFDLVIPCNDPSLIPLQENRDFFCQHPIYLLDKNAYDIAFHKTRCLQLASSLSIPTGRFAPLTSTAEAEAAAAQMGFPLVLKPARSYHLQQLRRKNHVKTVRTSSELTAVAARMLAGGELLAQEYFQGVGVGIELIAHEGRVLAMFSHRRLHEPRAGGGSSYRMSILPRPELVHASERLIAELAYTGVAMIEFRYDFNTDQWVFLEINGRFWGSLPLALACGVDFPWYLFEMLVQGRTDFSRRYSAGVCCRNLESDVRWMREQIAETLRTRRLPKGSIRDVVHQAYRVLTLRERCDTFVGDDPWPGVAEACHMSASVMSSLGSKLRRVNNSLPPVRAVRRRRALAALRQSRNILFVCKGNICRSPFAQRYAEQLLPAHYYISSCGYYPEADRRCPSAAVSAAREAGIDLAPHRSQLITAEALDAADMIFVFDEENWRVVAARGAKIRRKLHRLGDFRNVAEIEDPFDGDIDDFRNAYRIISEAIGSLVPRLALREGYSPSGEAS